MVKINAHRICTFIYTCMNALNVLDLYILSGAILLKDLMDC